MEILIKKSETNPNGILELVELKKLIKDSAQEDLINKLIKLIDEANKKIESLETKLNKIDREFILNALIVNNNINFTNLSILSSPSLEKDDSIKAGTIYYNSNLDCFRGKLKNNNWSTLNIK